MTVDVLIVLYNAAQFVGPLLASLSKVRLPITCYFLDNASKDSTVGLLLKELETFPHRAHLVQSIHNNGFARGINLLAAQGKSDLLFVLNQDTVVREGCLEALVSRAGDDSSVGMVEARQVPREHPKTFDRTTGETSWCTGAAVLIHRKAFEAIGGFDERFFMYCEDVDLSWKFWLEGWKCIYAPDAVVEHYTQDLLPGKRRTLENYFVFRNSLFLFYRFGSWKEKGVLLKFLARRFLGPTYSLRSRLLYLFAFVDHIRYIPYLLKTRQLWCSRSHPWVRWGETSLAD